MVTLREMDALYTAPAAGFTDGEERITALFF
jgi:predicted alpha/beta-fold hydrolase